MKALIGKLYIKFDRVTNLLKIQYLKMWPIKGNNSFEMQEFVKII